MSEHFKQSVFETGLDSGYVTPDKLRMIKRVFDETCATRQILDSVRRDDFARKLMYGSRTIENETALAEYAMRIVSNS